MIFANYTTFNWFARSKKKNKFFFSLAANYKKTLALIGIVAILLPGILLSFPQKAQAVVPVTVVTDPATIGTLTSSLSTLGNIYNTASSIFNSIFSLEKKEYILDPIAYAIAGTVLKSITNSIIRWINNGFQGGPGFITDSEAFFADAADQATGRFMKEFLSPAVYNAICSPFRVDLLLALKLYQTNTYAQRMRCTLSTVLRNAQNGVQFGIALRNGNWGDWMSATLNFQNNPAGALLASLDELDSRQANARYTANTESIFNQGFLSMKACAEYYADEWTGENICVRYQTTSPGKWISDTLSEATGIDMQRLAVADEINEILSALINQLILTGIRAIR